MIRFNLKPAGRYWPLIVVVAIAMAMAFCLHETYLWMRWMHQAMGFFLILLAMLKLFDIPGFQRGFRKYDLMAQVFPLYGYVYPFLELGLGLSYLSQSYLTQTAVATIIIMSVGLAGIMISVRQGRTLNCACMGNVLNVPLSTVSILENGGMILMSAWMLACHS